MTEAGIPVLEAIKSATVNASELPGISDKTGSIQKGKLADIIALDGDPTKDVQATGTAQFVMKDGIVCKN